MAASVAIGLDVMDELVDAEVTDRAGQKGRHYYSDRAAYRNATEDDRSPWAGGGSRVRRP